MITNSSVILKQYFNNDIFDVVSFRQDCTMLSNVFKEYKRALDDSINNVGAIVALDSNEYFKLTTIRYEFNNTLQIFESIFEQTRENILGYVVLLTTITELEKQLEDINEMLTTIEERLDSGDLKNLVVVDLLQTIWNKYDSELALFSYNNLTEQSMNNKPWLVIDTISDFDEVAYISSFNSKPEALRYAMSKGLGFSSVVCRY